MSGISCKSLARCANRCISAADTEALPVPPLDAQNEIISSIETAFANISRLAIEAAKAPRLLGHLDQRIMARAFAGEIVPQDHTNEPAKTFLARIREARLRRHRVGREVTPYR